MQQAFETKVMTDATSVGPRRALREGVVIVVQRSERWLVIQRAACVRAPGKWCFVGGGIEPGESQEQAVSREFAEEVGGSVRPIRKIWEFVNPEGTLRLHWWLAEPLEEQLTPNPAEVAEIRWLATRDLLAIEDLLESNRRFLSECQDPATAVIQDWPN